jgi:hypothetical protein
MDPAITVLLAVITSMIAVGMPLLVREFKDMRKLHDNTHSQCDKLNDRQTIVETKLDMLLDAGGFDIHKVNRTIKEHMEELKENDKPSIGCIDIKKLYKEG